MHVSHVLGGAFSRMGPYGVTILGGVGSRNTRRRSFRSRFPRWPIICNATLVVVVAPDDSDWMVLIIEDSGVLIVFGENSTMMNGAPRNVDGFRLNDDDDPIDFVEYPWFIWKAVVVVATTTTTMSSTFCSNSMIKSPNDNDDDRIDRSGPSQQQQ